MTKAKRYISTLIALLTFTSCVASSKKLNRLSLGMDRSEVEYKMGEPDETAADKNTVVYVYRLARAEDVIAVYHEYWLVFKDDKLTKYGKAGDFGTSAPDVHKFIIEQK